jgi:hypothetical protein
MSRYYQGYQPAQRRQQDFSELERMRLEQQQRNQQAQSQDSNMNGIGKLAKYFSGGNGSATAGGGTGTAAGQGFESFGAGGANGGGLGYDMNGFMGQGTPAANGGSWYSNLFSSSPAAGGGGGGASAAASSNPYGWIAAALLSANVMHNKKISPWSESIKGQGADNLVDYFQGNKDGKQHGAMSKVLDEDGATGNFTKAFTDFGTFDFSNGLKNTKDGFKNALKLKFF